MKLNDEDMEKMLENARESVNLQENLQESERSIQDQDQMSYNCQNKVTMSLHIRKDNIKEAGGRYKRCKIWKEGFMFLYAAEHNPI